MNTPTLEEVKEYFSKAKEINCLRLNIKVDVSSVSNFTFDEADGSWNSYGNVICFWKGEKYAEITKKKCAPGCQGCKPCEEKRKKLNNGMRS